MIQDRKLIKWQPFLLPEQRAMLKQQEIERLKVKKPELDEYELLEINDVLVQSLQDEQPIELKLWLDGFIKEMGPFIITKIDPYKRQFLGIYKESTQSFSFDALIGAKRI